jgi:rubrerythrin
MSTRRYSTRVGLRPSGERPGRCEIYGLASVTKLDEATASQASSRKLWYCKQCGYVIFREDAPYICPICRAKKEFFAELKLDIQQKTV